ncbi:MAG: hypothetical protein ACJ8CC_07690, partial [Microvirga sp.]
AGDGARQCPPLRNRLGADQGAPSGVIGLSAQAVTRQRSCAVLVISGRTATRPSSRSGNQSRGAAMPEVPGAVTTAAKRWILAPAGWWS